MSVLHRSAQWVKQPGGLGSRSQFNFAGWAFGLLAPGWTFRSTKAGRPKAPILLCLPGAVSESLHINLRSSLFQPLSTYFIASKIQYDTRQARQLPAVGPSAGLQIDSTDQEFLVSFQEFVLLRIVISTVDHDAWIASLYLLVTLRAIIYRKYLKTRLFKCSSSNQ
jgi:hypothetical protein